MQGEEGKRGCGGEIGTRPVHHTHQAEPGTTTHTHHRHLLPPLGLCPKNLITYFKVCVAPAGYVS